MPRPRDAERAVFDDREIVSAAISHRRLLVLVALALFGVVFVNFVLFEVPGLGLGHFFYVPVALLALALGLRAGLAAGLLATALYALAIVVTPRLPVREVLTAATVIRLVTYSTVGALIGWYADQHRTHIDRLRELADRDFLTGLLNARVFDEALARRCADDRPFAIVLADIDDLKLVNDAHGHAEGNRTIRRVGELLDTHVPAGTDVARVGGDEFALLIDLPADDAQALCSRLKRTLARAGLDVSFGWAGRPADGASSLELFRKADDRLYAAKLLGRNRRTVVALAAAASH
jgi:diguanylate cyclase (GGDEF)-like protein